MPIIILRERKATKEEIEKMSYQYGSYIKVVVDIEKGILAGGGQYHADEEQLLLEYGCKQENLWGAGVDIDTGTIDYDSMINIRQTQSNPSRIVADPKIRKKIDIIIKDLIL